MILLAPIAVFAQGDWTTSGEFSTGFDSNLSNAPADEQATSSAFIEATAHAGRSYALGESASLLTRASLRAQGYARENALANARVTGLARLAWKPDADLYAPTFGAWASLAEWRYASTLRDSHELRGGIDMLEHVTTQVNARLSAGASRRFARSAVFDVRSRNAAVDLDWRPLPRLALYGSYQYLSGDTVASADSDPRYLAAAIASQPDDGFEHAPALIAYRLAARTQVGTAGFNYALTQATSFDAQLQYVTARSDAGLNYTRWIGIAGLLCRFD